jgi:hypothetical protein
LRNREEKMPDSSHQTEDWNIRKFPRALKKKCQGMAKEENKREPRWLAELVCAALQLSPETYLDPVYKQGPAIDSTNESEKKEVRHTPGQTDSFARTQNAVKIRKKAKA